MSAEDRIFPEYVPGKIQKGGKNKGKCKETSSRSQNGYVSDSNKTFFSDKENEDIYVPEPLSKTCLTVSTVEYIPSKIATFLDDILV